MDGIELRIGRVTKQLALFSGVLMVLVSLEIFASDEPLDIEFLEWLGQRVEIEELGVDVDDWDNTEEQGSEKDDSVVDTQ